MSKPKYTIAITGLNAIDSPGPGIAVIRAIRECDDFDVRIIGLSYENLEPGIYMHDLVDKSYSIPYPSAGHEVILQRLDYINEVEDLDLIIPNFDAELFSFIKLGTPLRAMGVETFLPTEEQFDARLKGRLVEFGEKHGIKVPKSDVVLNIGEMSEKLQEYEYPVVVKGKFYEAYIAYSYEQAVNYFHKIAAKWGTPIILQEFIQGEEYNVTALSDGKGNLIGAVPMKKQYITEQGKAWSGITIEDKGLIKMSKDLVTSTRWKGGFELEMIVTEEGEINLIEINPRFPAWVYLAKGAGQNHPAALVKMAMGLEQEAFTDYEVGKLFIRYSYDMICDLADFEKISALGEL